MAEPPQRAAQPRRNDGGEAGSRSGDFPADGPVGQGVWVAEPPQRAAQPRRYDGGEAGSRSGDFPADGPVGQGVWVAEPLQRAAQPRRNDDGEAGSRFPRTRLAIDIVRRQGLEPRTR
ncbi:hypothetical protein ACIF85_24995 [Streptomyces sp. NPDC086033]|uniref:hypothetical protein n=1 Tax=Streptomyces sp. NPDC086033 TaxID=3365747 RepID=UPI0037CE4F25